MKHLFACLLLAAPLAALPQIVAAQTPPPGAEKCEGIKDDMAYNNCLAAAGPQQGERIPRINDAGAEVKPGTAARRGGRSRGRVTSRGGRQRAVFDTRGSRRGRR